MPLPPLLRCRRFRTFQQSRGAGQCMLEVRAGDLHAGQCGTYDGGIPGPPGQLPQPAGSASLPPPCFPRTGTEDRGGERDGKGTGGLVVCRCLRPGAGSRCGVNIDGQARRHVFLRCSRSLRQPHPIRVALLGRAGSDGHGCGTGPVCRVTGRVSQSVEAPWPGHARAVPGHGFAPF